MTWEIVVGISILLGFVVAIVTPLLKLNTSITRLNCTVEALNISLSKIEKQVDANTADIEVLKERIRNERRIN